MMPAPISTKEALARTLIDALGRRDLDEFRALVEQHGRAPALAQASARLRPRLPVLARRTLDRLGWLGAATVGDVLLRLCAGREHLSRRDRERLQAAQAALVQVVVDLVVAEPIGSTERADDGAGPDSSSSSEAAPWPRPAQPPPRTDPARLAAWAERQGVASRLDEDLFDFLAARGIDGGLTRTLRPLRGRLVLRDAILMGATTGGSWLVHHLRSRWTDLQRIAVDALHAAAWERFSGGELARARAELVASSSAHPALVRLAGSLARQLEAWQRRGDLPADSHRLRVEFEPERAALHVYSKPNRETGLPSLSVRLPLDAGPDAAPRPECACGRSDCEDVVTALDRLVPWLLDEPGPPPGVVEELERPSWQRALDALEAVAPSTTPAPSEAVDAEAADEGDRRLTFRLHRGDDLVLLEPLIHRRLDSGRWSRGVRLGRARMRTLPVVGEDGTALRRALRLLAAARPDEQRQAVVEALEALAGTDSVFLSNDGERPVAIRRGALGLTARTSDGGGLRVGPAVGADPLPWSALARLSPGAPLLHVDEERRLCLIAEVTDEALGPLRALAAFPGEFPPEAVPKLWAVLDRLGARLPLHLPPEVLGERVEPDPRTFVRLELPATGLRGELCVRPLAGGPAMAPGDGPARQLGLRDGVRVHLERDLAAERERASRVRAELPLGPPSEDAGAPSPWSFSVEDDDAALDLIASLQARDDVVVEWPASVARRVAGRVGLGDLRMSVASESDGRTDWLGLDGECEIDGHHLALAQLFEAVRAGRRYVAIDADSWVAIEGELRERLASAVELVDAGRTGLRAHPASAPLIAALVDGAREVRLDARFRERIARARAANVDEAPPPATFAGALRPYQLDGFRWLMRLSAWGLGGCLADDMGLGKTLQALALLAARAPLGPALVVAPTSVCANWAREAERFVPSLRRIAYGGSHAGGPDTWGPGDLVIASYGRIVRDAEALSAKRFATLVLDEAQAIKNADTQRSRAVRSLAAEVRVALTGTPVENRLGELWSLMEALAPGLLGGWNRFRARFAQPIEEHGDDDRRRALARVLRPFLLRRTKAEVAPELPPRSELQRLVVLSPAERAHYDAVRLAMVAQVRRSAEGHADARFAVLAAITRLRLLACNPRLLDPASPLPSAKMDAFLELVDELRAGGHRALVFSQFTTHLALVSEALERRRVPTLYLDGRTSEAERAARVARFQRGEGELFLISLKAGGTGLNLTAADYVVHLDPWWNPAVEDQATDRAHRIGQERPLTVYRLVSAGTVEEQILALHDRKRHLVASLLDGASTPAALSIAELLSLLGEAATGE